MNSRSPRLVLAVGLIFSVGIGCSSREAVGPERAAVTGAVMLDAEPLQEGSITFIPVRETKGPTSGGTIQNGRYSISQSQGPVVGLNRVEIRGNGRTGRWLPDPRMPGKLEAEVVEIVPKKFHLESQLERQIQQQKNAVDFELTRSESERRPVTP